MELTFATYNIHKAVGIDRRRDPERIVSVLREVDADVIVLQEADRRFGTRASVLPRAVLDDTPWKVVPVATRPRSIGWHGNAILVRRTIVTEFSRALDLPMMEPRGAVMAVLNAQGERFCIAGMHLDLSGLRRRAQLGSVVDATDRLAPFLPTVLAGDFNQWGLSTGAMRILGKGKHGWQPLSPGSSYPSSRPIARLDRIVADRHWQCLDVGVHHSALASQASDHLPVWARLQLSKTEADA